MRDIREELKQRLSQIEYQRATLRSRMVWLDEMETHIKAALEYEKMHSDPGQANLFSEEPLGVERSATGRFIREALSDLRPKTLDELKLAAEQRGMMFGEKNPGRVLHFALVGMKQSGIVERSAEGRWRLLTKPGTEPLM
jgi:hypothetical protein